MFFERTIVLVDRTMMRHKVFIGKFSNSWKRPQGMHFDIDVQSLEVNL